MERRRAGMTLLEVLVAILIIAVVAMVLLNRRIDLVRDAAKLRTSASDGRWPRSRWASCR